MHYFGPPSVLQLQIVRTSDPMLPSCYGITDGMLVLHVQFAGCASVNEPNDGRRELLVEFVNVIGEWRAHLYESILLTGSNYIKVTRSNCL